MTNCRQIFLIFSLLCLSNQALGKVCGRPAQGDVFQILVPEYNKIMTTEREFYVDKDGRALLVFGRDAKLEQKIKLLQEGKEKITKKIAIASTKWDVQELKGVPQRKVTPAPEDQNAIANERNKVGAALQLSNNSLFWKNGFTLPTQGRISGKFGGQRVMNGLKMNPHAGTDIAAPIGSVVKAAGDGVVILAVPNLFYSGNVVIVDHGFGLQTVYAHLNKMGVVEGQKVAKGDLIGEVGKTGRVTGPHLHWGASLQGVRFNPFSLLKLENSDEETCKTEIDFIN